jgi:hypothetical protein
MLTRMSVRDGRILLPDGMSYRLLVLPNRPAISLPVLRKIKELAAAGATVIGPKPTEANSLENHPACDAELAQLADALWGRTDRTTHPPVRFGAGRILAGTTARDVLQADGVPPDFEFASTPDSTPNPQASPSLDFIHRRDGPTDIYFVAHRSNAAAEGVGTFRVTGRQPELWDPVSGQTRTATSWTQTTGRTSVPLCVPPYGSLFVVFRSPGTPPTGAAGRNFPTLTPRHAIEGPWTVTFDTAWGGPASVVFPELVSWTRREEDSIRFYSGTATYVKEFQMANCKSQIYLDLGQVKQLAEVRLNGKDLGVLWAAPFRVNVTGLLRPAGNRLEIDVVNFWPNRVIGDAALPPAQRRTRTNIRKLTATTPLVESGLLGPVRLLEAETLSRADAVH